MSQYTGGSEVVRLLPPARDVDVAKTKSDIVQIFQKRFQWVEKHLQEIEKDLETSEQNPLRRILTNLTAKTSTKELIGRINKVRAIIDAIKDNFQNLNDKNSISFEEIQEFIDKTRESERRLEKVEQKLFQKI